MNRIMCQNRGERQERGQVETEKTWFTGCPGPCTFFFLDDFLQVQPSFIHSFLTQPNRNEVSGTLLGVEGRRTDMMLSMRTFVGEEGRVNINRRVRNRGTTHHNVFRTVPIKTYWMMEFLLAFFDFSKVSQVDE